MCSSDLVAPPGARGASFPWWRFLELAEARADEVGRAGAADQRTLEPAGLLVREIGPCQHNASWQFCPCGVEVGCCAGGQREPRAAGLRVLDTILVSHTELIANPASYADPSKRKAMEQLQTLLSGALEARGRVLVKMNVEESNLDTVIGLLPALRSPTVSKLFGEEGYAVETVVAKAEINTLIPALRDAGATGIIELPIAKIVP